MDQDVAKARAPQQAVGERPKAASGRQLAPATMTIFGASGDLTKRLIVPALCHLVRARELPDEFTIIGVDHNDRTTAQWRQMMADAIQASQGDGAEKSEKDICSSAGRARHALEMRGDFTEPDTFDRLGKLLAEKQKSQNGAGNVLFYLRGRRPGSSARSSISSAAPELAAQSENARVAPSSSSRSRSATILRPRGRSMRASSRCSPRTRSTGSIISSARQIAVQNIGLRACASPTASSSRCGIAITSTRSRSPPPRPSASRGAGASTSRPARCVTWCRTIRLSSCSP